MCVCVCIYIFPRKKFFLNDEMDSISKWSKTQSKDY